MENADLYASSNPMQTKDAEETMKEFRQVFTWGKAEKILDVGSGPGHVTTTILKKFLPEDASLVGSDISKQMVDYAVGKFQSSRVAFRLLDIENVQWDTWSEETFNKIFSFYCFHWVRNHKLAVQNVFSLLKPDGQLFLVFLARVPIFELYALLSSNPRWVPYMKDADQYICKYHYSSDPAAEFKVLLTTAGFRQVQVTNRLRTFTYKSMDQCVSSIAAVNPFIKRIPTELLADYEEDVRKAARSLATERDGQIEVNYSLVVAYAAK